MKTEGNGRGGCCERSKGEEEEEWTTFSKGSKFTRPGAEQVCLVRR